MANMVAVLVARRALRRERVFRDREQPLELDDDQLIRLYKIPRHEILHLIQLLTPDLSRDTRRSHALSVSEQILTALLFYASGSFQYMVGRSEGPSQASMSRIVRDVSTALVGHVREFISFPVRDRNQQARIKMGFERTCNFPNVLGVIDGTHIAIIRPSEEEFAYVNRKRVFSINVQVVGDSNLMLLDVVAKWPGSTHDSFMLAQSGIGRVFEEGQIEDGWLLGDSGYPLKSWLMTPLLEARLPEETHYNRKQMKTRRYIECLIGVLKSRFRSLHRSSGDLCYSPQKCCLIITSCCIIHNICTRNRIPLDGQDVIDVDEDEVGFPQGVPPDAIGVRPTGVRVRQQLMNVLYRNRRE